MEVSHRQVTDWATETSFSSEHTVSVTADVPFQAQGQKKVASMMESKEVHKGIYQIEWEHKKMEMEMEDLNQKAWDIQMLFFSRDRQKARLPSPSPRVHLIHSFICS